MDRNGASIYGCGASEIAKPGWGRITESNDGRTIYLHIFERPADGGVSIPMPKAGVKQVQFLPTGKALAATTDDRSQRLRIDLPALSKDALVPVIAVYMAE
jgi:alpha-L-fucosidase